MKEPSKTSEVMRLLMKAVKELPEEEQRVVFEYFFERAIETPPTSALFAPFAREGAKLRGGPGTGLWGDPPLSTVFTAQRPGTPQVMIPVRMSEDLHARLKTWCAEHGFPMSVVVRGLVDRFLDSWEQRAA